MPYTHTHTFIRCDDDDDDDDDTTQYTQQIQIYI